MLLSLLKIGELKLLKKYSLTHCYNNPEKIIIGVTRRCNLNCVWCNRKNYNDRLLKDDINFEYCLSLASTVPKNTEFHICGFGEPLLYNIELLSSIYKTCKSSYKVLTTNGTLLNKHIYNRLLDSGVKFIHVSIDSPYEETYENIRGFSLKQVKEKITDSPIPIIINMVLSEETKTSFKDMIKFAKDVKAFGIHVQNLREWGGGYHRVYNTEENQKFVADMFLESVQNGLYTDIHNILHKFDNCYQLFTTLYVNTDGYATICCGAEFYNLVKCYNVKKCWNSTELKNFRRKLLNKDFPRFCKTRCIELRNLEGEQLES